jgi:hypothetical protein
LSSSDCIKGKLSNEWGHRTGLLFFCSAKSILLDEGGLHRLFRFWGGEATYAGHEEDGKISARLGQIGKPCIVQCSVPFRDTNRSQSNLSEYLIAFFISSDIQYSEPGYTFDVSVKRILRASEILTIIPIDEPGF